MSDRHQAQAYPLRLPEDLKARVAEAAKENGRSLNSEIVSRLGGTFESPPDVETLRREIAGLKNAEPLHRLYVLLDAHGYPLSWAEIHELVSAIGRTGKLSAVEMEIQIITPDMESSSRRAKEAADLARRLRAEGKSRPIEGAVTEAPAPRKRRAPRP